MTLSPRGLVTAVRQQDGRLLWTRRLGVRPAGDPAAVAGRLFVGDATGHLWALSVESGQTLWRARLGGVLNSHPVPARGGQLVVGTRGGRVQALSQTTGRPHWHLTLRRPVSALGSLPGGDIVVLSLDRTVRRLDGATGQVVWHKRLVDSARVPPVADAKRVYVLDAAGRLYGIETASGRILWRREGLGSRSPGLAWRPGHLLVGSRDSLLHCLNPRDGIHRWIKPLAAPPVVPPTLRGRTAWVVTHKPRLLAVRLDTGGHYLSQPLPGPAAGVPVARSDAVLVVFRSGRVIRYGIAQRSCSPRGKPPSR